MSDATIDRSTLPSRRLPFQGVVKRTLDGSAPDWNIVAPIAPPEGAPNIPTSFGGPVDTPTLDRLAEAQAGMGGS